MIASAKHLEIQMSMPIQAPPFSPPIRGEGNASIYLFVRKIYFTHEKMTFSYNENCRGLCHIDLDVSLGYTLLANMLSKHSERTRDATSCPFFVNTYQ